MYLQFTWVDRGQHNDGGTSRESFLRFRSVDDTDTRRTSAVGLILRRVESLTCHQVLSISSVFLDLKQTMHRRHNYFTALHCAVATTEKNPNMA